MPGTAALKLSSPFPSVQITFETKEEINGKSLLIWRNISSACKLNFKCEKQTMSSEFLKIKKNLGRINMTQFCLTNAFYSLHKS